MSADDDYKDAAAEAEEEEDDYEEEEAISEDDGGDYSDKATPSKRKSSGGDGAKAKAKSPGKASGGGAKKARAAPAAPLDRLLAPLDAASLAKLLAQVCARTAAQQATLSNEDFVRQEVGGSLSLVAVDAHLERARAAEKKIWPAFPHTRFGSSRDHFCYKRVRPVQAIFIKTLTEPLADLKDAKNPAALLRYLRGAIDLAEDLPQWDDAADNKPRIALFNRLAAALRIGLRAAARGMTEEQRKEWRELLADAPEEIKACAALIK